MQASQRGSCFLQTAKAFSAQAEMLVKKSGLAMGELPAKPKPFVNAYQEELLLLALEPAQKPKSILVIFSHKIPMSSSSAGPAWVSKGYEHQL